MSGSYLSVQVMWSKDVRTFIIAERLCAISDSANFVDPLGLYGPGRMVCRKASAWWSRIRGNSLCKGSQLTQVVPLPCLHHECVILRQEKRLGLSELRRALNCGAIRAMSSRRPRGDEDPDSPG